VPVVNAGGGGGGFVGGGGRGRAQIPGVGMNLTPNAVPETLATIGAPPARAEAGGEGLGAMLAGRGGAGGGRGGAGGGADVARPRVILRFPTDPNDMLLSGGLVGGQALSGRSVVVDAPVATGHIVMFANRPFWR